MYFQREMLYHIQMKSILILILLSLIPSFVWAQPAIKINEQAHDFGTITPAASIAYDFEFSNNGTEDLVIEKLVPS